MISLYCLISMHRTHSNFGQDKTKQNTEGYKEQKHLSMVTTRNSRKRRLPNANANARVNAESDQHLLNKAESCSLRVSRRCTLRYKRRIPCSSRACDDSTKKETQYGNLGDDSCVGVEPSNIGHGVVCVDAAVCEDKVPSENPSIFQGFDVPVCEDNVPLENPSIFQIEPTDDIMTYTPNDDIVIYTPNSPSREYSGATSVNLSAMLSIDEEFSSIDSKKADAHETNHGYRVKRHLVPILKGVLSKHGDIGVKSKKSLEFRSLLIENVCHIVRILQVTQFLDLTAAEIESFRVCLKDMESEVNVGWLIDRLDEINEAKRLLREYPQVKLAKVKSQDESQMKETEIERYEDDIRKLEEKIKSAKHEKESRMEEQTKLDKIISHMKVQLKKFHCRNMTDGLI